MKLIIGLMDGCKQVWEHVRAEQTRSQSCTMCLIISYILTFHSVKQILNIVSKTSCTAASAALVHCHCGVNIWRVSQDFPNETCCSHGSLISRLLHSHRYIVSATAIHACAHLFLHYPDGCEQTYCSCIQSHCRQVATSLCSWVLLWVTAIL